MSAPVAVLLSIAVGGVLGLVNGLLIAYGRVHAIIITFGTANLFLFLGPADLRLAHGQRHPADVRDLRPRRRRAAPSASRTRSRSPCIVTALAWWYLRHTAGGRHFYAIGGDAHAARLAGVRVQRRVLLAYLVTGLLVGLGSCFVIAQGTSTLDQSVGTGKELAVIAAVVIGGTSIMGGRGSVLGTLLGALLVQSVTSGCHPARLELAAVGPVRRDLHHRGGRHRPAARTHPEDAMTTTASARTDDPGRHHAGEPRRPRRCGRCSPSGSRCSPC